jgi:hypothetical protein
MKMLLIICSLIMVLGVGYAQAQQYEIAPADTKYFTTTDSLVPGQQACYDIWLTGAGAAQNAGGAWIDFTGSVDVISYVSAGRALSNGSEGPTGPWDPAAGVLINEPAGPGTLMYVVANLAGAPPDGDGDIIVGRLCMQCEGFGDAQIHVTTIPGV